MSAEIVQMFDFTIRSSVNWEKKEIILCSIKFLYILMRTVAD